MINISGKLIFANFENFSSSIGKGLVIYLNTSLTDLCQLFVLVFRQL